MKAFLFGILFVLALLNATAIFCWWRFTRTASERRFQDWAKQNNFIISRKTYCTFFRGPYFWAPSHWAVFQATLIDPDGWARRCWVCFGDHVLNFDGSKDLVDVEWDGESKASF